MSLKAKIEAVIYASEEPVTLQQLVGLLGLEAQAELDAADARQGRLALEEAEPAGGEQAPGVGQAEEQDVLAVVPEEDTETLEFATEVAGVGPVQEAGLEAATSSGAEAATAVGEPFVAGQSSAAGQSSVVGEPSAAEPSTVGFRARERRVREYMRSVLDRLVAEYRGEERGLEIREIAGGYRFATKPEYHDAVRGFARSLKPPLRLSLQALETLAVVAYKQPVTAPEVSEVRGVDSGGVLGSLMARKLVATAGRKQVIGRPILYKTTRDFLLRFGLKDVSELPSIEEFQRMEFERMAVDGNGTLQEEISMAEETVVPVATAEESGGLSGAEIEQELQPSRTTHLSQADGDPNPSAGSPDEVDAENLTPAPDGPSEFTGNESVPPAENTLVDARISGVPPVYDTPNDEMTDSPANDAAVQGAADQGDV